MWIHFGGDPGSQCGVNRQRGSQNLLFWHQIGNPGPRHHSRKLLNFLNLILYVRSEVLRVPNTRFFSDIIILVGVVQYEKNYILSKNDANVTHKIIVKPNRWVRV